MSLELYKSKSLGKCGFPIKSYDLSKFLLISQGGTVLISVLSQQYNCLLELYTNFTKFLLFMKMYLPSTFYVRAIKDDCACIYD